jgi:tetratricopeptide (TPR) repeat protein
MIAVRAAAAVRAGAARARAAVLLGAACAAMAIAYAPALTAQRTTGVAAPTFARDVAPLLAARCGMCHHPGGAAPFSVFGYDNVRPFARQIAEATTRGVMPPWPAKVPPEGEFVGQQHLTAEEIALLKRWADSGAPQGDKDAVVPVPAVSDGWRLGAPDLVISTPRYMLRADGTDAFRIFVIPIPARAMRYVRGIEFRPGNPRVVHHANIRIDTTEASRRFDEADAEPGYDGLIAHSAGYPDGHFLGWTPGQVSPLLPRGLSWRLNPDSDLVVELHMVPSGKPEPIETSIGFYFTPDAPEHTPAMLRLGRQSIDIPAGEASYTITDAFVLPVDAAVQAVQPHAHWRAQAVTGTATFPDGTTRSLIDIPRWDFRWQHVYRYRTPVALPKGTTIAMRYTYDNSAANPRNPVNPPRRVYWGQKSADEMGDLWIQVLTKSDDDLATLNAAFRPKVLNEDVLGYERWIKDEPGTLALHDDVAMLYLQLNRPTDAIRHFGIVAAYKPEVAAAHFNLATALTVAGLLTSAVAEYNKALAINPDYAQAHNNLGSIFLRTGRIDEAMPHVREATRLDPNNPQAHYNLGVIALQQQRTADAIASLKRSIELNTEQPSALAELAWLLAAANDDALRAPALAVSYAEHAVALTARRDAAALDVLAASYAAAGDFARAVSTADAALALSPGNAADIAARRALYAAQQAFRLIDR